MIAWALRNEAKAYANGTTTTWNQSFVCEDLFNKFLSVEGEKRRVNDKSLFPNKLRFLLCLQQQILQFLHTF